jgi:hypothetical protein
MIFLYVFMQGLILSGDVPPHAAVIISKLWVVGVLPIFVGVALLINGLFVSKRIVEIARQGSKAGPDILEKEKKRNALRSAETTEFIPSDSSVTEETTKHLSSPGQKS